MNKIAIVDDNPNDASLLEQSVLSYFESKGEKVSIELFYDGSSFLSHFQNEYTLLFLDVEMYPMNGFELASAIRERDENVLIVFVTNMAQLARKGYQYSAFDYIPKPMEVSELYLTLDRAKFHMKKEEERSVLLPGKNKDKVPVLISDITYIEVNGHYITVHTKDAEYVQYGVFKKVLEEMNLPYYFAKCNQCFVVNMKYIEKMFPDSILIQGNSLSISRPQKKAFFQTYMSFISGRSSS